MTIPPASTESVLDLRHRVQESLPEYAATLLNAIDAIAVGQRIGTAGEVARSPLFGFALATLYTALRSAAQTQRGGQRNRRELKHALKHALKRLRRARLLWLDAWAERFTVPDTEFGPWRLRVLDATNYPRPKAPTVERGYAHGAAGMGVGHALSVLSERVAAGSWVVPLEIEVVPVGEAPSAFGARQIVEFVHTQGWDSDEMLAVDAGYTNVPTLRPMVEAGALLLGRISGRRVLFRPPPPRTGKRGRPAVRGAKIKLWDQRTLPSPGLEEAFELDGKRRFEVARYDDVRMRSWPEQRLTLYRIVEYRADGRRRFKRPLWLIYAGSVAAPSPRAARALYGARYGIEHSFRFLKGELGLVSGQFNGDSALGREALWVELVATAFWELFALRGAIVGETAPGSDSTTVPHVTPGAARKQALGIFVELGITRPKPTPRGKSPGRAEATTLERRRRYKVFRKRKRKRAA